MPTLRAALVVALSVCALAPGAARAADPFERFDLNVTGAVRNTLDVDVNGDGLRDLLVSHVVYDEKARRVTPYLSTFLQTKAGYPRSPTSTFTFPADAVVADVGNVVAPASDVELVLVRADRVDAHAFKDGAVMTEPIRIAPNDSLFTAPDWTAVRLWEVARDLDGDGVDELFMPELRGTSIYERGPEGLYVVRQELRTPLRHKVLTYEEHEWFVDRAETFALRFVQVVPEVSLREFDGDGTPDLVFALTNRVQVHRGLGNGRFEERANPIDLRYLKYEQLLRYARNVAVTRIFVEDMNADGLADVVLSQSIVNFPEGGNQTDIFLNRGGQIVRDAHWSLKTEGLTMGPLIGDLNGDDRTDVLVWYAELGLTEIINYLLFGRADVTYAFYLADPTGKLPTKPTDSIEVPFEFVPGETTSASFTGRRIDGDYNGDGKPDLLVSKGKESLLLYTGEGGTEPFDDAEEIEVPGTYFLRATDLNGDGRSDATLRHEHRGRLDSVVTVLRARSGGGGE